MSIIIPDGSYVAKFLIFSYFLRILWQIIHPWARSAPEELGGQESHIADLVLTSELTTSLWGDQHLFFRHQNMEDDLGLRPDWEQYTEKWTAGVQTCKLASLLQ